MRRQHWLLQETRFLFLTRKGPIEIILKPSLILGIGFVGIVGMTVIGATTLFVGFKSVEVVRNESISTAEASATMEVADSKHFGKLDIGQSTKVPALPDLASPVLVEPIIPATDKAAVELVMSTSAVPSIPWPPSSASTDSVRLPPLQARLPLHPPANDKAPTKELALADNYAEPEGLIPLPPMPDPPDDDVAAFTVTEAAKILQFPDLASFLRRTDPVSKDDVEVIAMAASPPPTVPEQVESGLVPFNPDNNLPVVTDASRQYKLLRSMAREVRGIRDSLSEIGLPEAALPELDSLDQFVEAADFARLAMAVEDHRSLLRKVPLKPPMLYFYISSNYGMRLHPVLKTKRFHHGIDLAGTWQETVHAP
ncbi:MAG: M23 family metallopeptidase, partial [Candidatus Puniceispirillaceae bacterium]